MLKRLIFLATLAVATTFATDAWAQAAALGFSGYSQKSGASSITYSQNAGVGAPFPVTLSATAPVNFTISLPSFLQDPAGTDTYDARLTLTATSSSAVQGAGLSTTQDGFSGMFTIRNAADTLNLLSGSFSNALLSQSRSGVLAFETNMVDFTSDIFVALDSEDFILGFSGSFGALTTTGAGANRAYTNFSANRTSGDFNALAVPEPATLAMAGLGVLGLPLALRAIRRRKKATAIA